MSPRREGQTAESAPHFLNLTLPAGRQAIKKPKAKVTASKPLLFPWEYVTNLSSDCFIFYNP